LVKEQAAGGSARRSSRRATERAMAVVGLQRERTAVNLPPCEAGCLVEGTSRFKRTKATEQPGGPGPPRSAVGWTATAGRCRSRRKVDERRTRPGRSRCRACLGQAPGLTRHVATASHGRAPDVDGARHSRAADVSSNTRTQPVFDPIPSAGIAGVTGRLTSEFLRTQVSPTADLWSYNELVLDLAARRSSVFS